MQQWWQGEFKTGEIGLSVTGPAYRFGFGFFETLLWDGKHVIRLNEHLGRIHSSLKVLGLGPVEVPFESLIPELCQLNGLSGSLARVNIIYAVDEPGADIMPVITAVGYEPPAIGQALEFVLSPRPFQSWLGAHKSANYLYYHLEHQAALKYGAHGAVICSPAGHILEAAHASLLFHDGRRFVTPADPNAGILPGISLAAIRENHDVVAEVINPETLGQFGSAFACNSLMGVRAITQIGDVTFVPDFPVAERLSLNVTTSSK